MRLKLKSGEYFDFHNVRKIKIIEWDHVRIEGNFKHGGRYKTVERRLEMIEEWDKFMQNAMKQLDKMFEFGGVCPHCKSENVWKIEKCEKMTHINKKNEVQYRSDFAQDSSYWCKRCHKNFSQPKKVEVIVYEK